MGTPFSTPIVTINFYYTIIQNGIDVTYYFKIYKMNQCVIHIQIKSVI